MIAVLLLLGGGGVFDVADVRLSAPSAVVVATSRGERTVAVTSERGHPALAVRALGELLPVTGRVEVEWARVEFAGQPFRFLLDAPVFRFQNQVVPVMGGAYVHDGELFVPLQWLAQHVPRVFHEAYRYDPLAARFEEVGLAPVITRESPPPIPVTRVPEADVPPAARRLGLRRKHKVVVDAGHGGADAGTRGGGLVEKTIVLSIAKLVRAALEARGIEVVMTRTRDVLPRLEARAPMCGADCDLFLSIHANALKAAPGYRNVGGLETFFFDHRRSGAPDRVEMLENAALRYEPEIETTDGDPVLAILQDLEENEYLRESAQLADLIDAQVSPIHPNGSRRVGQLNLAVLRLASRPAVLVEAGFQTNPRDARFLRSPQGQRRLAEAIAEGVLQYLLRYESQVTP